MRAARGDARRRGRDPHLRQHAGQPAVPRRDAAPARRARGRRRSPRASCPAGVRDVIRQRLERVAARGARAPGRSPPSRATRSAGAAGRRRRGATRPGSRARIAEAVARGRLGRTGGAARASRTRSCARCSTASCRDAERRALHGAVGDALEQPSATAAEPPLMELAHHALEAPASDLAAPSDLAVRAAARATAVSAPEEAVAVLERARAGARARRQPARAPRRACCWRSPRRASAAATSCRASRSAARSRRSRASSANPTLLARAALTYGRVFKFAVVDPVLVDLLENALAALPSGRQRAARAAAGAARGRASAVERHRGAGARRARGHRDRAPSGRSARAARDDVRRPLGAHGRRRSARAARPQPGGRGAHAGRGRSRAAAAHARAPGDRSPRARRARAVRRAHRRLRGARRGAARVLDPLARAAVPRRARHDARSIRRGRGVRRARARAGGRACAIRRPSAPACCCARALLRAAERHDEMRAFDAQRAQRARFLQRAGLAERGLGVHVHAPRGRGAGAISLRARARRACARPTDNRFAHRRARRAVGLRRARPRSSRRCTSACCPWPTSTPCSG